MKTPLSSQTVGKSNMKMKKTCQPQSYKKIANSCGYLIFFAYLCENIKS